MKKWALQMRTLGRYVKHSALIDSKYNKNWSRTIFIILSLLFFGAFFIWFNDSATILGNEFFNAVRTDIINNLMNGGKLEKTDIDLFLSSVKPLIPNIIRIAIVPFLTIMISILLVFPYVHINVYENSESGEEYVGKALLSCVGKTFGRHLLVFCALIVPVFLVSIFGGAKWFLNYGIIPTIIFAFIYLVSYFTICFQIDPEENDEGSHYPYDAVSKQVKTIIHARIKDNENTSMNEQLSDIGDIVSNIEKSYTDDSGFVRVKKSPFKKALLLFKITWGRSMVLMMILQYVFPMIQVLLVSLLKYTHRDMIVYAGLGFFTAFALMFEVRFVCKLYSDLIHGVRIEEIEDNHEREDF